MEILPATTVTVLTTGMLGVVTANILPVLGIFGFAWGYKKLVGHTNKSSKARV